MRGWVCATWQATRHNAAMQAGELKVRLLKCACMVTVALPVTLSINEFVRTAVSCTTHLLHLRIWRWLAGGLCIITAAPAIVCHRQWESAAGLLGWLLAGCIGQQ